MTIINAWVNIDSCMGACDLGLASVRGAQTARRGSGKSDHRQGGAEKHHRRHHHNPQHRHHGPHRHLYHQTTIIITIIDFVVDHTRRHTTR